MPQTVNGISPDYKFHSTSLPVNGGVEVGNAYLTWIKHWNTFFSFSEGADFWQAKSIFLG